LVGSLAADLSDKADTAGVVLMGGRVQGAEALCGVEDDLIHGSRMECGPGGGIPIFETKAGRFKTFLGDCLHVFGQAVGMVKAKNGHYCVFLCRGWTVLG
jgi:hypothetical protein